MPGIEAPDLVPAFLGLTVLGGLVAAKLHVNSGFERGHVQELSTPGWIARRKARRGVSHPNGGVAIGYSSAWSQVEFDKSELNHHGSIFGGPGSGKTTLVGLLAQGHNSLGPCIIIDGKGSLSLRRMIAEAGGLVWTIGGSLKLDLLSTDPTILGDQITEATRHEGPSEVYTEAAVRAIQWIGWILRWEGKPSTLEEIEKLLMPGALLEALKRHSKRPRVAIWLAEMEQATTVEISGMTTALMRITRLIDGAGGPSLGSGPDAIRFEDVVQGKTTLLVSLENRLYPSLSRVLGGWALIALRRACLSVPGDSACLFLIDEVAALGRQARHIEPLLTMARDCNVGVVLAGHGPTQLDTSVHGMTSQVLQMTSWQIVLAQGDPTDADTLSRLFPLDYSQAVTLGHVATGVPTVTRDHLQALGPGDCFYRVRPVAVGRQVGLRWGRARLGMPAGAVLPAGLDEVIDVRSAEEEVLAAAEGEDGDADPIAEGEVADNETSAEARAGSAIEAQNKREVYRSIKLIDGWRMWGELAAYDSGGWPRAWISVAGKKRKQWKAAHRLVWAWENPDEPCPRGWDIDHDCGLKRCMDHLKPRTRGDNVKRQRMREQGELPTGHDGMVPPNRQERLF
jgi:hypothetical protein